MSPLILLDNPVIKFINMCSHLAVLSVGEVTPLSSNILLFLLINGTPYMKISFFMSNNHKYFFTSLYILWLPEMNKIGQSIGLLQSFIPYFTLGYPQSLLKSNGSIWVHLHLQHLAHFYITFWPLKTSSLWLEIVSSDLTMMTIIASP